MLFSKISAAYRTLAEFLAYQRDKKFTEKQYWQFSKKGIDWNNPKTYNEKLQIYKLSKGMEKLWPYTDKWLVRKFVRKQIGSKILNKVYGIWEDASEINFNKLPKRFVLKTNHGSGWNIIVKDKSVINFKEVRNKLNAWLKINYYDYYGKERQYKLIKPKILCVKYLEDKKGQLKDYKFFCFDGKAHFIQVDIGRYTNHKRNFYDRDWKSLPFTKGPYPNSGKIDPKPKNFRKMVNIAEKLSSKFKHARIDLYNVDGKIYFSETTFTPDCGLLSFRPEKYNRIYGDLLHLCFLLYVPITSLGDPSSLIWAFST